MNRFFTPHIWKNCRVFIGDSAKPAKNMYQFLLYSSKYMVAQSLSVNWGNTSRFLDLIPAHTRYWSNLAFKNSIKTTKNKGAECLPLHQSTPLLLCASGELSGPYHGPLDQRVPSVPSTNNPWCSPTLQTPKLRAQLQSSLATNTHSKVSFHLDLQFQQMNDDSWTYGTLLIPGSQTFGNTIEGVKYHWSHFLKKKNTNQNTKEKTHKKKKPPQIQGENLTTEKQETSKKEGGASSPISAGSRHKQCRKSLQ